MTPWITETFDGVSVPASPPSGSPPPMPANWSQYNSDEQGGVLNTEFAVTNTTTSPPPALSGDQSLSVMSGSNGKSGDVSRAWLNQTMPADLQVSAAIYVDSLIPAQVIARGSYLNAPDDPAPGQNGPSFYAVELASGSPGPVLTLVNDVNGSGPSTLATIQSPTYINNWLEVTLDVEGSTVRAQLFNPTTGDYLYNNNGTGQWQTGQTWALTVIDNSITGPGMVGLGRAGVDSYTGTVTFDNFSVQTPSTDQSFDATPVGSLPDNWSWYGTNMSSDVAAVASPTNLSPLPSAPNVLAITPHESGDSVRAWLDTSLPANLSVSAYTYLDTLTPEQVFARGSDLDGTSPSYYAAQVTYGYVKASLVKVVNGTPTILASSATSNTYVQNVWVQETLWLNGDNLSAIVYQPGKGLYLNSAGDWVNSWTTAVTATDSSIASGGQAGVGRPVVGQQTMYVDTEYLDDFTTATGTDSQDFDFTPPSPPPPPASLFPGWSKYSNNGTNYFAVENEQSSGDHLSGYNALVTTEMSNTYTAAAWDRNAEDELTNAQATAAVYMTGTMPTLQFVARGLNLGSPTPSYYGLSFTESPDTGPELDLVRVNGGGTPVQLLPYEFPGDSQTELPTYDYLNDIWVQETLYVDGDNVRASIYRTDTGNEGNIGTATTTITVSNNTTLSMPSSGFPAHPNTVGITELDYGDNNADQDLVQNYVDVVVGGTKDSDPDVAKIHDDDSSVQQLVYTNVSNIALGGGDLNLVNNKGNDPLLDFLNYAEANDDNPEGAFYHVAVATPYGGGSIHSTLPVDEFWGVYDANGGNDTANAYTGTSIPFGNNVNQAVYIGYLEPSCPCGRCKT